MLCVKTCFESPVKRLARCLSIFLGLTVGIIGPAALHGQPTRTDDRFIRSVEQTLATVLQWEILWNDSLKGFRLPGDGSIVLAIHAVSDSVSYCSHQAGVCVTYRTGDNRNWEGREQARCDDNRSDLEALITFIGKESNTRAQTASQAKFADIYRKPEHRWILRMI